MHVTVFEKSVWITVFSTRHLNDLTSVTVVFTKPEISKFCSTSLILLELVKMYSIRWPSGFNKVAYFMHNSLSQLFSLTHSHIMISNLPGTPDNKNTSYIIYCGCQRGIRSKQMRSLSNFICTSVQIILQNNS